MKKLRKLPWTKKVLQGDRRAAVEQLFVKELLGERRVVSADLTAASDLILHSHAQSLWKGILSSTNLDTRLHQVVMDAMGP